MRILLALTYYRPHISGLTIYAERLARALIRRGHRVTVLTSQYDRSLPRQEIREGARILRVPVALRVSKGVLMPTIGLVATREVLKHDVLSLHLPQLDAAGIAVRGRLFGRPTTLTYHCDILLPPTPINRVANRVVDLANHIAARSAHAVVAYTQDYAVNSPFLSRYMNKVRVIPPPVEIPVPTPEAVRAFSERHRLNGQTVIGMGARLATEKGVEYLLGALPALMTQHPNIRVLFAGPYQNVIGEEAYARRMLPVLEQYKQQWTFLGKLEPAEMAAFFANCHVTVLPSINSTESFGLVQIESMICGAPVVASNLPGVRQPVRMTGMGEVAEIRDSASLAQQIHTVLANRERYLREGSDIARRFSPEATAEAYERLFVELGAPH